MGKTTDVFEALSGLYLVFMIIIILLTAAAGDHKLFLVVVGFFPTVLTVIISLLIHEQFAKQRRFVWIIPVVIILLFYMMGKSGGVLGQELDVDVLAGVNFILSLLYVLIVSSMYADKKKKPVEQPKEVIEEVPTKSPEKTIQEYIHSIEDKSKAINFVIGRVYSQYHGGTKQLREKIRIPSELYNEFSLIGVGTDSIDYGKLNDIITKLELILKSFEKTEVTVFKTKALALKNLIRDPAGNDQIKKVLDYNDKDPFMQYYEGAVDFCKKIRDAMEKQDVDLVKNNYVPKNEDEEEEIKELQKRHP